MAVIALNLRPPHNEITAVGNGVAGGHVWVERIETIDWKNQTPTSARRDFLVSFFDWTMGQKTPIWPFDSAGLPAGSTCVGPGGTTWLRVPASGVKTRLSVAAQISLIKYDVHVGTVGAGSACVPDPAVPPLDPAMIIRPQTSAVNVAFGVTCAVLGAVAGALVTALLS
jgi:hypothetical protein